MPLLLVTLVNPERQVVHVEAGLQISQLGVWQMSLQTVLDDVLEYPEAQLAQVVDEAQVSQFVMLQALLQTVPPELVNPVAQI